MFGVGFWVGCHREVVWQRMRRSIAGLSHAVMLSVASVSAGVAGAQAADVRIVIAPLIQIPTGADTPIPIELAPRDAVPGRSILLIKGLPATISLSQGRLFDSGVWGVPVTSVDDLRMITGAATVGRTAFSISLVSFTGDLLAETKSSLMVVSGAQPIEATAALQDRGALRLPDSAATRPADPPTGKTLDYIKLCMEKGDDAMRVGNVATARMFYTQAAEHGWADGAFALATTYDPTELANLRIEGGIQPDEALAKRWYEKAAQLGSKTAETRLFRLGRQ